MAIWGIVAGALRVSVAAPEACGDLPSHELRAAAGAAIGWVQRAQLDGGRYVYLYDAESDDLARDYNDVRHAGVTMALYQSAGRGGDEQAQAVSSVRPPSLRRGRGRLVVHLAYPEEVAVRARELLDAEGVVLEELTRPVEELEVRIARLERLGDGGHVEKRPRTLRHTLSAFCPRASSYLRE